MSERARSERVLILGATSGIAAAVAEELARQGYALTLAGRDRAELERYASDYNIRFNTDVHAEDFDATNYASHESFIQRMLAAEEGVKGIVLCYGFMCDQSEAATDFSAAHKMIDINYTSVVSVLNEAANVMEKRGHGFLCVLSSVAGDRGRPSNYIYGSTKAALDAYLEGLRARLAKVNIPVTTVKPGPVDTAMTWGLERPGPVAPTGKVAKDIVRGIQRRCDVVYTPIIWWPIMTVIKNIPRPIFKKLNL